MLTIAIPVFDNAEILDFSGPYEVFTTAERVHRRRGGTEAVFRCLLVGRGAGPVRARGGMLVSPDASFDAVNTAQVLVVPGGDVSAALGDLALLDWIAKVHAGSTITASICTGVFLLAQAGLLRAMTVTTHWEDQDELQSSYPDLEVVPDVRWVDSGKIVTSGGISAGIDMSLHLVQRLAGIELAIATARQMEYAWKPDERCEANDTADSSLLSLA